MEWETAATAAFCPLKMNKGFLPGVAAAAAPILLLSKSFKKPFSFLAL
jgi:hypothetical protein